MGRRKTFNRLPQAKQLAKQLILHRLWDGKTQDTVAKLLGVTFQQYQKLEKCENRVFAEQLMLLCQEYKWDPQIIFFADPVLTLNEWVNSEKPKVISSGVNNSSKRILHKFYVVEANGERNYMKEGV
mgnify:FL=1|tara:strand:+ start:118 stop:498 length:381 start_codon:yes stop_codon:yes gene_type:complete